MVEKLPRISAALNGGDESRGKTVDTLFAPTDKAIENFLSWTRAQNKTEEFAKILGNQTVAGAIVAYHVLPELVYKFGTLKAFDRKFINTALSNAVSDTSGAFALQIDEEGGSIFIKGTGSEVKVIGADNYACNGIIHLVDGVLLPFDADGELSEKQKERLEDAKEMLSEAIEEEEEEMEEGASPAPAPDAALSIGLLTDLGGLGGDAPAPAPSPSTIATTEESSMISKSSMNLRSFRRRQKPRRRRKRPKSSSKTKICSKPSWTKVILTSPPERRTKQLRAIKFDSRARAATTTTTTTSRVASDPPFVKGTTFF